MVKIMRELGVVTTQGKLWWCCNTEGNVLNELKHLQLGTRLNNEKEEGGI